MLSQSNNNVCHSFEDFIHLKHLKEIALAIEGLSGKTSLSNTLSNVTRTRF